MNLRQIFVILALAGTLLVNWLANALPINGITTGEVSDSYPVLFTPAGYVFAIWGVIYLLLLGYVIYQALPAQRENPLLQKIAPWFILNTLANTVWIFFWHYQLIPITVLLMLGVLIPLIVIYRHLLASPAPASLAEKIFTRLPFSVYLGWITVATVANITIALYDLNWNGFGISGEIWTVLLLLVAAGLGFTMTILNKDIAYTLVLIWAFVGIFVKQSDTPLVAYFALGMAVLSGLLVIFRIIKDRLTPGLLTTQPQA
jgi:translocator protein